LRHGYRQALPNTELIYLDGPATPLQHRLAEVMDGIEAFLTAGPPPVAPCTGETPLAGYAGPRQP